jgi:two-component system chemotaxis sensor kinase CheA
MDLDLAQFHDTFFEESFEALDGMEAALLKLDVGAPNAENVNTIFRVAHSIKGGAGMFGFTDVASFTHTLETLLDELRSGRMQVTTYISDQLLISVDVLRAMMRSVQRKEPVDMQRVADLQFDLEQIVAKKGTGEPPVSTQPNPSKTGESAAAGESSAASSHPPAAATPEPDPTPAAGRGVWIISFRPLPELLLRGNDPLAIFSSLRELGTLRVTPAMNDLPRLREMDAERCYLTWRLELESDCTREQIEAAFDWAAGDCEVQIERREAPAVAPKAEGPASAASTEAPKAEAVASAVSTVAPKAEAAASAVSTVAPKAEAATSAVSPVAPKGGPANPATAAPPPAAPPPPTGAAGSGGSASPSEHSSIRVSIEKIDELINTVGELVITQAMLSELGRKLEGPLSEQLRSGLTQLERNMRELQESVMRVRMLPISFTFSRFPRMVRDLAQRLGKQIELKMTGEQTELDKTVLEKIGDPLVHLVRNSVDHGIEPAEVRVAAGKSPVGTVHLDACHRGGNIAVEIRDDGGGLDKNRILAKARSRGLVGPNDVLTDEQIYELIFLPGFSTAEKTTDVSGRGVGMDVVRRNVKELGGKIEIFSDPGKGSRFIITLPLTLAIVDGQSVAVGNETYIVPLTSIIESLQLQSQNVSRLSGRQEVFWFRGDYLPILRLHEVFGVKPRARALHEGLIVVAEGDGRRVGLFVDELLGQQQVVIKSMETNYGPVDGVAGATILGDGAVALILDLPGLIRMASKRAAA